MFGDISAPRNGPWTARPRSGRIAKFHNRRSSSRRLGHLETPSHVWGDEFGGRRARARAAHRGAL